MAGFLTRFGLGSAEANATRSAATRRAATARAIAERNRPTTRLSRARAGGEKAGRKLAEGLKKQGLAVPEEKVLLAASEDMGRLASQHGRIDAILSDASTFNPRVMEDIRNSLKRDFGEKLERMTSESKKNHEVYRLLVRQREMTGPQLARFVERWDTAGAVKKSLGKPAGSERSVKTATPDFMRTPETPGTPMRDFFREAEETKGAAPPRALTYNTPAPAPSAATPNWEIGELKFLTEESKEAVRTPVNPAFFPENKPRNVKWLIEPGKGSVYDNMTSGYLQNGDVVSIRNGATGRNVEITLQPGDQILQDGHLRIQPGRQLPGPIQHLFTDQVSDHPITRFQSKKGVTLQQAETEVNRYFENLTPEQKAKPFDEFARTLPSPPEMRALDFNLPESAERRVGRVQEPPLSRADFDAFWDEEPIGMDLEDIDLNEVKTRAANRTIDHIAAAEAHGLSGFLKRAAASMGQSSEAFQQSLARRGITPGRMTRALRRISSQVFSVKGAGAAAVGAAFTLWLMTKDGNDAQEGVGGPTATGNGQNLPGNTTAENNLSDPTSTSREKPTGWSDILGLYEDGNPDKRTSTGKIVDNIQGGLGAFTDMLGLSSLGLKGDVTGALNDYVSGAISTYKGNDDKTVDEKKKKAFEKRQKEHFAEIEEVEKIEKDRLAADDFAIEKVIEYMKKNNLIHVSAHIPLNGSVLQIYDADLPFGAADKFISKSSPIYPSLPANYNTSRENAENSYFTRFKGDNLSERPNDPRGKVLKSSIPTANDILNADPSHPNMAYDPFCDPRYSIRREIESKLKHTNFRESENWHFQSDRTHSSIREHEGAVALDYDTRFVPAVPSSVDTFTTIDERSYNPSFTEPKNNLQRAPAVVGIGYDESETTVDTTRKAGEKQKGEFTDDLNMMKKPKTDTGTTGPRRESDSVNAANATNPGFRTNVPLKLTSQSDHVPAPLTGNLRTHH